MLLILDTTSTFESCLYYRHGSNFRIGNGREGWPLHAPFPAILVTAASENLPLNLVDQLDAGGRMVVPIGPQGGDQTLLLLEKHETGNVTEKNLLPVSFVPLIK